jgi:hypothetical protein
VCVSVAQSLYKGRAPAAKAQLFSATAKNTDAGTFGQGDGIDTNTDLAAVRVARGASRPNSSSYEDNKTQI